MRTVKRSIIILLAIILFGTIGYHTIEDMSFFESFYMTIITISSVGFGEIKALSILGRIHTLLIISFGIAIGGFTIGTLLRMLIEGELQKTIGRKKVDKNIFKLRDHYIICGFGRIGSLICHELKAHKIKFVVIENDPTSFEELEQNKFLFINSDATLDDTLIKAGIKYAKALVTTVQSDSDNVFISLSAKGLRPDIFILARSSDKKNEIKLKRAGATKVISPYLIGGQRMAQVLIRPTVVDFIDIAMMEDNLGLQMEESTIKPGSNLIGKNLIESNIRKEYGVIIVLIKKYHGKMIFNPNPNEILEENDIIVMLGETEHVKRINL